MAIEDYIPNFFGGGMPQYLPGLLGEQESAALQKRANVQGLLGAALTLAQGMSPIGPRRTAAQNILGALAGGFQAGQGAYQGATQNMMMGQQLAQSALEREQKMRQLQALRDIEKTNPQLAQLMALNATKGSEVLAEQLINAPIAELYRKNLGGQPAAPTAPMPTQAPAVAPEPTYGAPSLQSPEGVTTGAIPMDGMQVQEGLPPPQERSLGEVAVYGKKTDPQISGLMQQIQGLQSVNQALMQRGDKRSLEAIKSNNEAIKNLRDQVSNLTVADYDFSQLYQMLPREYHGRINALENATYSGGLTADQLTQRVDSLFKDANEVMNKRKDLTVDVRAIAYQNFNGKALEDLLPEELGEVYAERDAREMAKRRAGASSTNINMPSESERTAGFLTNRLQNSLHQMQTVIGQSPTAATPNAVAEIIKWTTGSDYFKNLATPEDRQRVEAAQIDILDAALTLGTGAAYTREQLEGYRKSYFPQLNDKPATIADKAKRLQSLLDSAMIKSGRAAPAPTGGSMNIQDQIQMELERRKGR